VEAFQRESACFYVLSSEATMLNKFHPARPAGFTIDCPYCSPGDIAALSHALSAIRCRGAVKVPDHVKDRRKNTEV